MIPIHKNILLRLLVIRIQKSSTSSNSQTTIKTEMEAKEWAVELADLARLGKKLVLLHPDGYIKLRNFFYYK